MPSRSTSWVRARAWLLWVVALLLLATLVVWRGAIQCWMSFPECSPFVGVPDMPGWDIPTDPQEKAAYDYAHALPTPPSAPAPVPFDFRAARIVELEGGKHVAQQYFEHLCATEAGEYINRRAENVDGFRLLRPRGKTEGTPEDLDRYGTEEPSGMGWFSDANQLNADFDLLGSNYVQPLGGLYLYVEYEQPGDPSQVVRVERLAEQHPTKRPSGTEAGWGTHATGALRVPYLIERRQDSILKSRYAYTWRGLRRERDREFGIGGGEFIVVDTENDEVLALKRVFNSTFVPNHPDFTRWSAARDCGQTTPTVPPPAPSFIVQVLVPDLHVNDAFVPAEHLSSYHQHLRKKIEKTNAN